jgi:hypothetical protein
MPLYLDSRKEHQHIFPELVALPISAWEPMKSAPIDGSVIGICVNGQCFYAAYFHKISGKDYWAQFIKIGDAFKFNGCTWRANAPILWTPVDYEMEVYDVNQEVDPYTVISGLHIRLQFMLKELRLSQGKENSHAV